jgi:hypothetical protein
MDSHLIWRLQKEINHQCKFALKALGAPDRVWVSAADARAHRPMEAPRRGSDDDARK